MCQIEGDISKENIRAKTKKEGRERKVVCEKSKRKIDERRETESRVLKKDIKQSIEWGVKEKEMKYSERKVKERASIWEKKDIKKI